MGPESRGCGFKSWMGGYLLAVHAICITRESNTVQYAGLRQKETTTNDCNKRQKKAAAVMTTMMSINNYFLDLKEEYRGTDQHLVNWQKCNDI